MKPITIAIKDLTRSLRSTFALLFMFVIPLLVTGMFYLMFGNTADAEEFSIPPTSVVIVNLDEGDDQAGKIGNQLVDSLQSEELASLMTITLIDDAAEAKRLVDQQEAGVALIVPRDFSSSFTDSASVAEVEFYQDPTLTLGPQIVASVLSQYMDTYAGIKITVSEALEQAEAGEMAYEQISPLIEQYVEASQPTYDQDFLLDVQNPADTRKESPMASLIGPIMGGMMIFYAFFTGVSSAESILREDEEGTLSRLFATPTSRRQILTGKFLSVGLTVFMQVVVLIIAARIIFSIHWGKLPVVMLFVTALVSTATTLGILICSLIKNTKQSGVIFGGLMTLLGMVGMINIFTGKVESDQFGIVPLFVPHGWAARTMLSAMGGASIVDVLPSVLVLFSMSVFFFLVGVWRFQKRYL